jgi:hypothetical protein
MDEEETRSLYELATMLKDGILSMGSFVTPSTARFYEKFEVEPETHPFMRNPKTTIVYSYIPDEADKGLDGYMSNGSLAVFIDTISSVSVGVHDPKLLEMRNHVSQTFNLHYFKPIPLGQKIYLITEKRFLVASACTVQFEILNGAGETLCSGVHNKVYTVKPSQPKLTQKL